MTQPFAVARTVIVAAGEAWEVGGPLLQSLREQLAALAECGEHGIVEDDLAVAEQRLEKLEETLVVIRSPSIAPSAEALRADVGVMAASAGGARRTRDDFAGEMASARCALAALRRTVDDDLRQYPEVQARIVDVPPPPRIPLAMFDDQLGRIADLAAAGAWATVHVDGGLAPSPRDRAAADRGTSPELQDLVERRRRLRGRLDAYTAKAAAVGCVEDELLERLRHDAETVLYEAPADSRGGRSPPL